MCVNESDAMSLMTPCFVFINIRAVSVNLTKITLTPSSTMHGAIRGDLSRPVPSVGSAKGMLFPHCCSSKASTPSVRSRLVTDTDYGMEEFSATSSTWMTSSCMSRVKETLIHWSISHGYTAMASEFHLD